MKKGCFISAGENKTLLNTNAYFIKIKGELNMPKKRLTYLEHSGLSPIIGQPLKKSTFNDTPRLQAYKSFKTSHIHVYERCRHIRRG